MTTNRDFSALMTPEKTTHTIPRPYPQRNKFMLKSEDSMFITQQESHNFSSNTDTKFNTLNTTSQTMSPKSLTICPPLVKNSTIGF